MRVGFLGWGQNSSCQNLGVKLSGRAAKLRVLHVGDFLRLVSSEIFVASGVASAGGFSVRRRPPEPDADRPCGSREEVTEGPAAQLLRSGFSPSADGEPGLAEKIRRVWSAHRRPG